MPTPSSSQPAAASYAQALLDARTLRLQGRIADAAQAYERAYLAAPDDASRVSVLCDLGAMHQGANEPDKAIAAYERLPKLKAPVPPGIWLNLARLYRQVGDREKAVATLKRLLEQDPTGPLSYQAGLLLIDDLVADGDLAGAEALARKLNSTAPPGGDLLLRLAISLRTKRDFKRAIALCEEVLKATPTNASALAILFDAARDAGVADALLADAKKATEGGGKAALIRLATFAARAGDAQAASTARDGLLALTPDDVGALRAAADAASQADRFEHAADLYKRLAKLQPNDPFVGIALGDALSRAGRSEEAIAAWKLASHYRPENPASARQYGQILTEHSLFQQAIQAFLDARKASGDPSLFAGALGEAYEGALRFTDAANEYLGAMDSPDEGAYATARLVALARDEVAAADVSRVLKASAEAGKLPDMAVPALARAQIAGGMKPAEAVKAFDAVKSASTRVMLLTQFAMDLERDSPSAATDVYQRLLAERLDPAQEASIAQRLARADLAGDNPRAAISVLQAHRRAGLPPALSDPGDLMLADLLLHEAHQPADAHPLYQALLRSRSRDTAQRAAWGLADCAFAEDNYATARDMYRQLAAVQPMPGLDAPPGPPGMDGEPGVDLPFVNPPSDAPERFSPFARLTLPGRRGAPYAAYQQAEMDFREGKLPEAKAAFQKLAAAHPDSEWAAPAIERALLITTLGANAGGRELSPDDPALNSYLMALRLFDKGEPAQASELLGKVPPDSALADEAAMLRAEVLGSTGDAKTAAAAYRKLVADFPESPLAPKALLLAARQLKQADDRQGAREALEQLVASYANSPQAATGKAILEDLRRAGP